MERAGSTQIGHLLRSKETAAIASRWFLDTGLLEQFGVALEIEDVNMGEWMLGSSTLPNEITEKDR